MSDQTKKGIKVGFIGLGLIGRPMAKQILKNGFDLTVYNRTQLKCAEFKSMGAKIAASPKDLASSVDVIITMVTGPADVEKLCFDKYGIVEGAKPGLIVIDMSTIGPNAAKKIGEKLAGHKIEFLDAPVTGSTVKAETGDLTIFVGGSEKTYKKIKDVLSAMGKTHHYMGESGRGQAIKMINNQILGTTIAAVAEGMLLADKMGVSRDKVAEVLKTVPAMSFMMNLKLENYVKNDFPLMFSVKNMSKDLFLAIDQLEDEINLPLLKMAGKIYRNASRKGLSENDFSEVIKAMS